MNEIEWQVFRINDCDWYLARSIGEACECYAADFGHDQHDEIRQLTEAELDKLLFIVDDAGRDTRQTISFREELENRRALKATEKDPKPELFASTEF